MNNLKVIKKNNEKCDSIFPLHVICEECESELEVEKEDIFYGYLGSSYVNCPVCGAKTPTDCEKLDIKVTKDNIIFPDYFYDFHNGVDYSTEEIKKDITRGIEYFRKNPGEFAWFGGSGNTFIAIYNMEGDSEYQVIVAKGYYETLISYEQEDYDALNR